MTRPAPTLPELDPVPIAVLAGPDRRFEAVPEVAGVYALWLRTAAFLPLLEAAGIDAPRRVERLGHTLAYVGQAGGNGARGHDLRSRLRGSVRRAGGGDSTARCTVAALMHPSHRCILVGGYSFGEAADDMVLRWFEGNGAYAWVPADDPLADERRLIGEIDPPLNIKLRPGAAAKRLAALRDAMVPDAHRNPHLRGRSPPPMSFFLPADGAAARPSQAAAASGGRAAEGIGTTLGSAARS